MPQSETVKKATSYQNALKTLAKNIKSYRAAKGLTQENMADHGFNYRHYQKIESGAYSPNLQTLHRVATVLGVTLEDLFKDI